MPLLRKRAAAHPGYAGHGKENSASASTTPIKSWKPKRHKSSPEATAVSSAGQPAASYESRTHDPPKVFFAVKDSTADGLLSFKRGQHIYVRFTPEGGLWEGFLTETGASEGGWFDSDNVSDVDASSSTDNAPAHRHTYAEVEDPEETYNNFTCLGKMASSVGSAEPIYLTPTPVENEAQHATKKQTTASAAPAPGFVTKSARYTTGHPTVCSPSVASAPAMHRATESIRQELGLKNKNSVFTPPQSPSVSWGASTSLPGVIGTPDLAVIDMAAQQASWMMLGKSRADIKWWAQHLAKDGPVGGYLVRVPESKKNALALIVKTKDDTIKNFLIGRTPTGFHLPPHSSQNLTLLLEELSHPAQAALPVPLLPGFFLNEKAGSKKRVREVKNAISSSPKGTPREAKSAAKGSPSRIAHRALAQKQGGALRKVPATVPAVGSPLSKQTLAVPKTRSRGDSLLSDISSVSSGSRPESTLSALSWKEGSTSSREGFGSRPESTLSALSWKEGNTESMVVRPVSDSSMGSLYSCRSEIRHSDTSLGSIAGAIAGAAKVLQPVGMTTMTSTVASNDAGPVRASSPVEEQVPKPRPKPSPNRKAPAPPVSVKKSPSRPAPAPPVMMRPKPTRSESVCEKSIDELAEIKMIEEAYTQFLAERPELQKAALKSSVAAQKIEMAQEIERAKYESRDMELDDTDYTITHPYDPQHTDELALVAGKDIVILAKPNGGWWKGRSGGEEGWFPANHVIAVVEEDDEMNQSFGWVLASPPPTLARTMSTFENSPPSPVVDRQNTEMVPSPPSPSASGPPADDTVIVDDAPRWTPTAMPPRGVARMMTLDPAIGGKAAQGSTGSVAIVAARFEELEEKEATEAEAKFNLVIDEPQSDAEAEAAFDVDAPISPPPMFSNSAIAIEALNAL